MINMLFQVSLDPFHGNSVASQWQIFVNGCLDAQMHKLVGRVANHWLTLHTDLTLVQDMTWHKAPWSLLLENLCSVPGHTVSK